MSVKTPALTDINELAVNTIRVLSMEAVEKAGCGHPGMPMGCADFAFTLFTKFLKFNPQKPDWPDRDRFVLSAGHGSMLLYSMLHLAGYDVSLDDIKNFRQWDSKTPGHPEYGDTPGVETTTGPLGQGFANGVGMALAERLLAARFNTSEHAIVDHFTYVLASDGDLMEGISHEAASLAGHLGLGKLVVFYDDNSISIEGSTSLAFSEDVTKRFEAYGWHVTPVDGHDRDAIAQALATGRAETSKPTIIVGRTTIGYGSPNKAGTADTHGAALGQDEVDATRTNLGWDAPPFTVDDSVYGVFQTASDSGAAANTEWERLLDDYGQKNPEKAATWKRTQSGEIDAKALAELLPRWSADDGALATRSASGKTLNTLKDVVPELIGGSADLAPSNNTLLSDEDSINRENFGARNLHFGVREHAMGAILNGMALHGALRPYGGTFLIFSDYMRPAIRLAALMKQPSVYVFTHDSIFLGEDGPTHQPIEHIASLRSIPNLWVLRPADANETAAAWLLALQRSDGPTALALTRQKVPHIKGTGHGDGVERGGYVIHKEQGEEPQVILIATGSEVHLAIEAAGILEGRDVGTRVVSLPCWELFDSQPEEYRNKVLPRTCTKRVAIEAASPLGWERYVGIDGKIVGIERFGASAPYKTLAKEFGFTADRVAEVAQGLV